jgi:hypothetical protein
VNPRSTAAWRPPPHTARAKKACASVGGPKQLIAGTMDGCTESEGVTFLETGA